MKNVTPEQRKKLIALQILAERKNNFDILNTIESLVYINDANSVAFTDGKLIYVGERWFEYSVEEMYFILNHEFDHIYYRHFDRFTLSNERERTLVNIATDIIINEILSNEGLKQPDGTLTRTSVTKSLQEEVGEDTVVVLRGKSSVEIYKEINEYLKNKKKEEEEEEKKSGQGAQSTEEPENGEQNEQQTDESQAGNPDKQTNEQDDKRSTAEQVLGSEAGKQYDQEMKDYESDLQKVKSLPKEEVEEIHDKIEKIKESIQTKMRESSRDRNTEYRRNAPPEPKIDWKRLLMQFLGRHLKVKEERNIRRPSSRYRSILPNVIMASNTGRVLTPRINVYLDISGSMISVIQNVRGILADAERYFKQYPGKFYEFDTEIYEFKSRSSFYKSTGARGGTDISKVLNHYIQDNSSDLGILITDAEDEFTSTLNNIKKPTLIVTNNKRLTTTNRFVTLVQTEFEEE